jgi:RecA-family ATPase
MPRYGSRGSLAIDLIKGTWYDHEKKVGGGVLDLIERETGLSGGDRIAWLRQKGLARDEERHPGNGTKQPTKPKTPSVKRKIVKTYDYTDEAGELLMQTVRYEPKDFLQRRPDGAGDWIWNIKGVRLVPYRLAAMLEAIANDHPIFITEGEKDVDNLATIGVVATTNPMGANKWPASFGKYFRGADVILIPDADEPGREHVADVAAKLAPVARQVRILELPKKDASAWLESGGAAEQLYQLAEAVRPWVPNSDASDTPSTAPPALRWLDMSRWDTTPPPPRQWAIENRVPLRQAGLFSGEGGTGKSIIELQKNVAHVLGQNWLGSLPERGPAFYIGAEDEADELHRRLAAIAEHYRTTFQDLIAGGLHVLCRLGEDATLCAANPKTGRVETTSFYRQIYEAAGDIKPKNISIDTLSRAFAGNEIDRVQVYAFAQHMQALAMVADGSVTILSHPSLTGIASGTGISGSTAWHGAFRFRQYLKGTTPDAGEQPDDDLRELQFKKNQYGPSAESIVLRYQNGLFLPEALGSSLDRLARDNSADETFLTLLQRFTGQGRNVSDKPTSNNYAPVLFAKENEARQKSHRKADFEGAMRRLFAANKIHVADYGRPSRGFSRLEIVTQ